MDTDMTYSQLFNLFTTRYDFASQIEDYAPMTGQHSIHIWLKNKTELTVTYNPLTGEFESKEEIDKALSSLVDELDNNNDRLNKKDSCWLIEFVDGYKIIISESLYEEEVKRNWAGRERLYEAHWFNITECRRRNRGIKSYGIKRRIL